MVPGNMTKEVIGGTKRPAPMKGTAAAKRRRASRNRDGNEKTPHRRLKRVLLKYGMKRRTVNLQEAYKKELSWMRPKLAKNARKKELLIEKAALKQTGANPPLEIDLYDSSASSSSCMSENDYSDGEFLWSSSDDDCMKTDEDAQPVVAIVEPKVNNFAVDFCKNGPIPNVGNVLEIWSDDDLRYENPLCIATVLADEECIKRRSKRIVNLIRQYKHNFRSLRRPIAEKCQEFKQNFKKELEAKRKLRKEIEAADADSEDNEDNEKKENEFNAGNNLLQKKEPSEGSGIGTTRRKRRHYSEMKGMYGSNGLKSKANKYKFRHYHYTHGLNRTGKESFNFLNMKSMYDTQATRTICACENCDNGVLPLSLYCLSHIVNDENQTLYKACSVAGCNGPVLRLEECDDRYAHMYSLCEMHRLEEQKNVDEEISGEYTQQQFTCPKCEQVSVCDMGVTQISCSVCGQVLLLQITEPLPDAV